jgi:hypothetical protein
LSAANLSGSSGIDPVAVAALCVGALSLAWNIASEVVRGRRRRHHRRRAGPADVTRSALEEIRDYFGDVAALGGRDVSYFDDPHRRVSQRLRDLASRTDDSELQPMLTKIAGHWETIFALAPAKPNPRVINLASALTGQVSAQPGAAALEKQRLEANAGSEAVAAALTRLAEIERSAPG